MLLRLMTQVNILHYKHRVLQQILAIRVEELKRIQYHIQLKHSNLLNEKALSNSEKGLNVQDTIEYLSALGNEASASGKLANGLSTVSLAYRIGICAKWRRCIHFFTIPTMLRLLLINSTHPNFAISFA